MFGTIVVQIGGKIRELKHKNYMFSRKITKKIYKKNHRIIKKSLTFPKINIKKAIQEKLNKMKKNPTKRLKK